MPKRQAVSFLDISQNPLIMIMKNKTKTTFGWYKINLDRLANVYKIHSLMLLIAIECLCDLIRNGILSYVMQRPSEYMQIQFIIKAIWFPFSCINEMFFNMKCSMAMAGFSRPRTVTVRLTSCSYLYLCFCCRGSGDGERKTHQS